MSDSYVRSYLKDGSVFVLASDWSKPVRDKHYIEGAICLVINGRRLLGFEEWDLVDQLWAYLIDGLLAVCQSPKPFEVFFPDQPLKLRLNRVSAGRIDFSVGNHSTSVCAKSLLLIMSEGGKDFIGEIKRLVPGSSASWGAYVDKCSDLSSHARAIIG